MRPNTLFLSLLPLFSLVAASKDSYNPHKERDGCLTQDEAEDIRDRWISFFVKIDAAQAKDSLTDHFLFYSDTMRFFFSGGGTGIPYTNTSAQFISSQVAGDQYNSNVNPFRVKYWTYSCDGFTFAWDNVDGTKGLCLGGFPIAGIDTVQVQSGAYLMERAYSEWNGAYLTYALGDFVGFPCPKKERRSE